MTDEKTLFGGKTDVIDLDMIKSFTVIDSKSSEKPIKMQFSEPMFRGKNGLVLFYAPWCTHCRNFADDYKQLATVTKGLFPVGAINCQDEDRGNNLLADYFNITGYPSIKIWDQGTFKDYTGGKSMKDLLQFLCLSNGLCDLV